MVPQVAAGKDGFSQADAPQRTDQHIGHGGEPKTKLIGPHGGGRGAVGIEIELAFLDAVLHVATGAIDLLVELTRAGPGTLERGHNKAWIGLALRPLRLGNDAPFPAPAVARAPVEVLEPPCRAADEC